MFTFDVFLTETNYERDQTYTYTYIFHTKSD